jgi:molybdate transport system substrate-binding protein
MSSNSPLQSALKVISSMATRHMLAQLSDTYAQRYGHAVEVESLGGVEAARRIRDGDSFDIVVLAREVICALADAERIDPVSRVDVARSAIAVAVKAGAPHPVIDSDAALREAVLDALASKIIQAPSGVPVASLVANDQVELGFQQLSELIDQPGVDVVGVLPKESQSITVFSGAVCKASGHAQVAQHFLAFLASPESSETKRTLGLEPA